MHSTQSTPSAEKATTDMAWHTKDEAEILALLDTSKQGLSSTQAQQRLSEYGVNWLPYVAFKSPWQRFFFTMPQCIDLCAADGSTYRAVTGAMG
jgi:magnesium-transporting ATPase (P-type)